MLKFRMDFLAIGDTTIDTFIRLLDAQVHCDISNENCTICMRFGDKIPFEFAKTIAAVGNSANAAVAAQRLGLSSGLMAWVGNDRNGEECIAALTKEGVSSECITTEKGKTTNSHYVLWYGPERTILIKHEAFTYVFKAPSVPPKAIYLSSMGEAGMGIHDPLADYLDAHPEILLAFQPGTYQMAAGIEKLSRIYQRTNVFIANKQEYQRILKCPEEDPKKLMDLMHTKGPRICFLTDGPLGAYVRTEDGAWKIKAYPDPTTPYERTGAGDAFSSTAVVALLLGKSVPEALAWGPINSMSVVQYVGAQEGLLSKSALEKYMAEAPKDYIVVPL